MYKESWIATLTKNKTNIPVHQRAFKILYNNAYNTHKNSNKILSNYVSIFRWIWSWDRTINTNWENISYSTIIIINNSIEGLIDSTSIFFIFFYAIICHIFSETSWNGTNLTYKYLSVWICQSNMHLIIRFIIEIKKNVVKRAFQLCCYQI